MIFKELVSREKFKEIVLDIMENKEDSRFSKIEIINFLAAKNISLFELRKSIEQFKNDLPMTLALKDNIIEEPYIMDELYILALEEMSELINKEDHPTDILQLYTYNLGKSLLDFEERGKGITTDKPIFLYYMIYSYIDLQQQGAKYEYPIEKVEKALGVENKDIVQFFLTNDKIRKYDFIMLYLAKYLLQKGALKKEELIKEITETKNNELLPKIDVMLIDVMLIKEMIRNKDEKGLKDELNLTINNMIEDFKTNITTLGSSDKQKEYWKLIKIILYSDQDNELTTIFLERINKFYEDSQIMETTNEETEEDENEEILLQKKDVQIIKWIEQNIKKHCDITLPILEYFLKLNQKQVVDKNINHEIIKNLLVRVPLYRENITSSDNNEILDHIIQIATMLGDLDVIEYLLNNKIVTIDQRYSTLSEQKDTILDTVANYGHLEIVKILVNQYKAKTARLENLLKVAENNNNSLDVIQFLGSKPSLLMQNRIIFTIPNLHVNLNTFTITTGSDGAFKLIPRKQYEISMDSLKKWSWEELLHTIESDSPEVYIKDLAAIESLMHQISQEAEKDNIILSIHDILDKNSNIKEIFFNIEKKEMIKQKIIIDKKTYRIIKTYYSDGFITTEKVIPHTLYKEIIAIKPPVFIFATFKSSKKDRILFSTQKEIRQKLDDILFVSREGISGTLELMTPIWNIISKIKHHENKEAAISEMFDITDDPLIKAA